MFTGSLWPADETTREDDSRHGEGCLQKRGHYAQVHYVIIEIAPLTEVCSYHRGEAQTKAGKKDQTQGHLKKKIQDVQRQIKQAVHETSKWELTNDVFSCYFLIGRYESMARELQSTQGSVANELEDRKTNCQQMRDTIQGLQAQLTYAEEKKKQVYNYASEFVM